MRTIFVSEEDLKKLLGREISQDTNYNAYTRLFITDENYVFKAYISNFHLAGHNIQILRKIDQKLKSYDIKGLVLPDALISYHGNIVGYIMSYIIGKTLQEALTEAKWSFSQKLNWFTQIYRIINEMNQLPFSFHIGDLHPQNILIDEKGEIWLIDIDSYTIDGLNGSPPAYIKKDDDKLKNLSRKYNRDKNGKYLSSFNTDIYCLLNMVMNFITGNTKFFSDMSLPEMDEYLSFLTERGINSEFVKMIGNLYKENDNYFCPDYVLRLPDNLHELNYLSYMNSVCSKFPVLDEADAENIISQIKINAKNLIEIKELSVKKR